MRVILREDVKGTGVRHEVKDVTDGYARNFLLPQKLAVVATPEALAELARLKQRATEDDAETRKRLEALARKIESHSLEFSLKTDDTGSVFGSVTKEAILRAMREHDWLGQDRADVELARPIKEIGDHEVVVDLKKGISAKLKVVVRSQP